MPQPPIRPPEKMHPAPIRGQIKPIDQLPHLQRQASEKRTLRLIERALPPFAPPTPPFGLRQGNSECPLPDGRQWTRGFLFEQPLIFPAELQIDVISLSGGTAVAADGADGAVREEGVEALAAHYYADEACEGDVAGDEGDVDQLDPPAGSGGLRLVGGVSTGGGGSGGVGHSGRAVGGGVCPFFLAFPNGRVMMLILRYLMYLMYLSYRWCRRKSVGCALSLGAIR